MGHVPTALLVLVLVLGPSAARAEPPVITVGTHSMIMKDSALYPGSRKFSFNVRSKDADPAHQVNAPTPGSEGDPTPDGLTGGGGVLEVYNSSGSGESFVVPLPPDHWSLQGDPLGEFRYVFSSTPPITKVYVKRHKVSIRGGKLAWGYTLDEPSQGTIAVRLTLGTGVTYCTDAVPRTSGTPPSSAKFDRPGKFQAKRLQLAPETCPALP